jgi:peptidoglycan/LPS O-acetylase OafA/YrhL
LRGIAAAAVVLYHLGSRTDAAEFVKYGYLGVAVFFVLSGYVITMVVGESRISLGYLGRFAARRSLRLDPPYWASILVVIGLAILATKMGISKDFPSWSDLFLHVFYLQDLAGAHPISVVYWTLCLEVQFYVALVLMLWTRQGVPLVIAFGVWSLLEHADVVTLAPQGFFIHYWFAFALGALTYWARVGRIRQETLLIAMFVVLACTGLKGGQWCFTAALTAGVLALASHHGTMGRWLSGPLAQFGGRISYSLYLFHPLVGWSAQSLAMKYTSQWTALVVGLAASIVSAVIAYWLVEKPAIRLSHCVDRAGQDNRTSTAHATA